MSRLVAAVIRQMIRLRRTELGLLEVLVLLLELALHRTERSHADLGRILRIRAQIVVMTRLVAAVVRQMVRLRRCELGLLEVLVLRLELALHRTERSYADLGRILRIRAQIVVMTRLVAAIVCSMISIYARSDRRLGSALELALILPVLGLNEPNRLIRLLNSLILRSNRNAGVGASEHLIVLLLHLIVHGSNASLGP